MPFVDPLIKRLRLLAQGARFDASCASGMGGGLTFMERTHDISRYIYHSWTEDGRCVPILKVLLTNYCIYDCAYCCNRRSNDTERSTFSPEELAQLTFELYRKGRIEGLFLSSGIIRNADYTMELMLRTIELLREKYEMGFYIHSKILPGTDELLIERIGRLSDRISVNVELPSEESLRILAPEKSRENIIGPIVKIASLIRKYREDNKRFGASLKFAPSGQSTQIIVGATDDTDYRILMLSHYFYRKLSLSRVYYSAYVPVNQDGRLPVVERPPLKREHRLYQADWLIRDYGFGIEELLDDKSPNLSLSLDPKTDWAIRNISRFPVEINMADLEELIRIPGIGIRSAKRIFSMRRFHTVGERELRMLKVPFKKIRHFITIGGKYKGDRLDDEYIRERLLGKKGFEQLRIGFSRTEARENIIASNTGEF